MTIQREQNRIIRNEDTPVLIIQGVAGSGKRLLPYTVLLTCSMHKKEKFHPKTF